MSVTLSAFLAAVDEIAREAPVYRVGGKAADGTCDCIGLVIGALDRCGMKWPGIHGSNWAARNAMAGLAPVTGTGSLTVGNLVYKAKAPGETGYRLPERYAADPDRNDYYHVGVVRSVSPLRIVHCTSPGGVVTDTRLGRWACTGALRLTGGAQAAETQAAEAQAAQAQPVPVSRATLRYGSRGEEVALLQRKLRSCGYDLAADGIFGPITRAAVRSYQASRGLTADGIAGPVTWAALDKETEE
ncbi:MAG: peptidoglycan-binding protein [Aristaeellaceae bacterium]